MLLYLISDRRALGRDPEACSRLVEMIGDAARAGLDYVQIRERDLPAVTLVALGRRAVDAAQGTRTRVFVNDRFDVALAAGLDGVHLTRRSLEAPAVRTASGGRLLIGVSTHSGDEVRAAEIGGADFVVCGPVYDTPSKRGMGEPLGPARVAAIAAGVRIPVLGIGGIARENAREAAAGIAGVAAIRMFQETWLERGYEGLAALAADLRAGI